MKKHAPAAARNREPILEVLRAELPSRGTVLEVASGTGEHAVFFASALQHLSWQPSDRESGAIASIQAHKSGYSGKNLHGAVFLDVQSGNWAPRMDQVDAIVCINMVHISPWEATLGLIDGAAHLLGSRQLPLVLYGPYFEQDVDPAPGNLAFDQSLRARNEQWGIRAVKDIDAAAARHGFARSARYEMPANNLTLVYRAS